MKLIGEITSGNGKKLQVIKGDLSDIPDEHQVDILVLSAFPNNYIPSRSSLIGALYFAGLSVQSLSSNKEMDLRSQYHCWLSKEINFKNIKRILCFEPTDRRNPFSLVAGIFQSIMSVTLHNPVKCIAMPLILTGDQGYSSQDVLKELISTCLFWLNSESSFEIIKIVEKNDEKINQLYEALQAIELKRGKITDTDRFDFFISYSRKNADLAKIIQRNLSGNFTVFFDTENIDLGANWLNKINTSLAKSERFIVCISPDYLVSDMCKYEFTFCNLKFVTHGDGFVLPIFLYSASLQFPMQIMNYHDAREGLIESVNEFCDKIVTKYAR